MKIEVKDLVLISLFSAIISVFSILKFPSPTGVPVTLQTFAVSVCGYLLGAKNSLFAVLVYILIGFLGVPVFSGLSGGPSHLFGLSGGFIFGFIPLCLSCALGSSSKNVFVSSLFGFVGIVLCHMVGVLQFNILSRNGIYASFLAVSFPYLMKDFVLILVSSFLSLKLKKLLPKLF